MEKIVKAALTVKTALVKAALVEVQLKGALFCVCDLG
jgi:hypothetical protein